MENTTLKKLRWRCTRRGLLELDVVLDRFLDIDFPNLDTKQQAAFMELSEMEDTELWQLISGQEKCKNEFDQVIGLLRRNTIQCKNEAEIPKLDTNL